MQFKYPRKVNYDRSMCMYSNFNECASKYSYALTIVTLEVGRTIKYRERSLFVVLLISQDVQA
jgi:hypothetical protein